MPSHDRPHREHRQDDAGASRDSAAGDQSEPARDRQAVGNHRHERGTVVGQRPCEQPQGGQRGDGKDGRQDPEPLEAAAEQGREVEAYGRVHPWDVPGVEGSELGRDKSVVAKVQHHHREEAAVAQRKVGEDRRQAHPDRDRQRNGDNVTTSRGPRSERRTVVSSTSATLQSRDAKGRALLTHRAVFASTLVLSALLLIPGLLAGPSIDAAVFLTVGRELAEGATPYAGAWDHKPPGIHFLALVAYALAVNGAWVIVWAASAVATAVLATLLFDVTAPVSRRPVAAAVALFAALVTATYGYALGGGMAETFAATTRPWRRCRIRPWPTAGGVGPGRGAYRNRCDARAPRTRRSPGNPRPTRGQTSPSAGRRWHGALSGLRRSPPSCWLSLV